MILCNIMMDEIQRNRPVLQNYCRLHRFGEFAVFLLQPAVHCRHYHRPEETPAVALLSQKAKLVKQTNKQTNKQAGLLDAPVLATEAKSQELI